MTDIFEGWEDSKDAIPMIGGFTPRLLAERAMKRGTEIKEGEKCQKCGHQQARFYYVRHGRKDNGCIWCRHLEGKTDAKIIGVVEIAADGTEIYHGKRKCGTCGSLTKLIKRQHNTNCYECSIERASEAAGQKAIRRADQTIKHHTNRFIIQSIERAGRVEVAPENIAEYFQVRALMEDCYRQNQIEQINQTGIKWEIGHKFPASGGGTEYRGKATVENLCLIQKTENRREGDNLPVEWTLKQVIRVSDLYASMSSVEAAGEWKKRMGWDTSTEEEKARRKAQEKQKDKAHKKAFTECVKPLVDALQWSVINEQQFQQTYQMTLDSLTKTERKLKQWIEHNRAHNVSMTAAAGEFEQVLHERLIRLQIVRDTFGQLIDAFEIWHRENALSAGSYLDSEDLPYLIKRAAVMWAVDVMADPKKIIQAFTHPFLSKLDTPKAWGTTKAANGKQYLTVWNIETGEPITEPEKQQWVSLAKAEWQTREQALRDKAKAVIKASVDAEKERLQAVAHATSQHNYGDFDPWFAEVEPEHCHRVSKAMKAEAMRIVKQNYSRFDQARETLNRWWQKPRPAASLLREWESMERDLFPNHTNEVKPVYVHQSPIEVAIAKATNEQQQEIPF
ncbi:hypothetical protein S780_25085 [Salmonella enterica]|nr:hypothetical protein [Salmonella enterica subsp. enterica]MID14172.1 hypothetical protein [Salmonella enterica]